MFRMGRFVSSLLRAAVAASCMVLAAPASAAPAELQFDGVGLSVVGEFIGGLAVPVAGWQFAPRFADGRTIHITLSYDTDQPDIDPSANTGTYRIGSLAATIPELGLSVARSSFSMQISLFDDCPVCDQFTALAVGVDSFASAPVLPDPTMFWMLLFGTPAMLADDDLPLVEPVWNFGNFSFDFRASDGSVRQVLLSFTPAAALPEPAAAWLLVAGLLACTAAAHRRRFQVPQKVR